MLSILSLFMYTNFIEVSWVLYSKDDWDIDLLVDVFVLWHYEYCIFDCYAVSPCVVWNFDVLLVLIHVYCGFGWGGIRVFLVTCAAVPLVNHITYTCPLLMSILCILVVCIDLVRAFRLYVSRNVSTCVVLLLIYFSADSYAIQVGFLLCIVLYLNTSLLAVFACVTEWLYIIGPPRFWPVSYSCCYVCGAAVLLYGTQCDFVIGWYNDHASNLGLLANECFVDVFVLLACATDVKFLNALHICSPFSAK
jgi:hypothetical protein